MESIYDGTLAGLFALLDEAWDGRLPDRVIRRPWYARADEGDLFADSAGAAVPAECSRPTELFARPDWLPAGRAAALLWELSSGAYDTFIYAWMSELPMEAALLRFAAGILDAGMAGGEGTEDARRRAEMAASNRLNADCLAARQAAYKAYRELDRLRGLLRFTPVNGEGRAAIRWQARCSPDHFVLPGLAEHFFRRFGEEGWVIVDERRGLELCRLKGGVPAVDFPAQTVPAERVKAPEPDSFAALWKHYHKTINNESRNNPALQRQFMPARYRKYIVEME